MNGPINDLTGKVWGKTSCLWRNQQVEVHRIQALEQGYCSQHQHVHKYNMFYVLSGRLAVDVWKPGLIDTTILGPGEMTIVPPGEEHRFRALEFTDALEIYWVELNPFDIKRKDTGGLGTPHDAISPSA